jgi:hypothetical protein
MQLSSKSNTMEDVPIGEKGAGRTDMGVVLKGKSSSCASPRIYTVRVASPRSHYSFIAMTGISRYSRYYDDPRC